MTKTSNQTPADPATREAKGAARETIGKLLGDDAEVRKGRAEQDAVKATSRTVRGGKARTAPEDQ